MALSIKDPVTERLAHELAQRTGETVAAATRRAIEERLKRVGAGTIDQPLLDDLEAIRHQWNRLPILDDRSPDDVLGYDENGLPR